MIKMIVVEKEVVVHFKCPKCGFMTRGIYGKTMFCQNCTPPYKNEAIEATVLNNPVATRHLDAPTVTML